MPHFGKTSKSRLETCHADIQKLFNEVVRTYDCSILEGVRSKQRQRMLVDTGKSTTMNSKHLPVNGVSLAVDVVPYPIAWGEEQQKALREAFESRDNVNLSKLLMEYRLVFARFYHFAGFVQGVANQLNIKIRWGGDWDGDNVFSDQRFHDLPHFELVQ